MPEAVIYLRRGLRGTFENLGLKEYVEVDRERILFKHDGKQHLATVERTGTDGSIHAILARIDRRAPFARI